VLENIKKCLACKEDHPLTAEFWYFSKKPNGKESVQCKATKRRRIAEYSAKNAGRLKELARLDYEKNPKKYKSKRERGREASSEYMKKWRSENKEKSAETNRKWREKNK